MHKYEKLEKIYYKRKLIKFLIIFLLFIFFIIIITGLIFNIKNSNSNKKTKTVSKKVVNTNVVNKSIEKNISGRNNNISKKEKIKKNNEIKIPTINFTLPKIELNTTDTNSMNEHKNIKKKKTNNHVKYKIKNEVKEKPKPKPKPIIIEEKVNVNNLINTFNKNPSFELAIQISNYYLNNNKLDLAKLWALKANTMNPDRYESWKIFAIILLKKNQKYKAKEVLQTYLNNYGKNENIQKLLRSIDE